MQQSATLLRYKRSLLIAQVIGLIAASVGFAAINPTLHLVDQHSSRAVFSKAIAINNTYIIAIALPETSELFDRR
ncbi:MAG: hypothetical protein V7K14_21725 [Nostoc sp.]|uniref:hypothetical protein n=1 Tax=Nostoc sp. TaxID=1180 RepID=UPI002FF9DEC5